MSFSNIVEASSQARAVAPRLTESLVEGWTLVRQVRQLEFDARTARPWIRSVNGLGAAIERTMTDHVAAASRPSALPVRLASANSPAGELARRHLEDQRGLCAAVAAFARLCALRKVDDIWMVVEVAEAAIELEMLIARHHNQLVRLAELAITNRSEALEGVS